MATTVTTKLITPDGLTLIQVVKDERDGYLYWKNSSGQVSQSFGLIADAKLAQEHDLLHWETVEVSV